MKIGILALQGAFIEHQYMLDRLKVESFEIRQLSDLKKEMDGIILPGGESTVMLKLLHDLEMYHPLRNLILSGLPVFGTCAGLILLAKKVNNDDRTFLNVMDITVKRNAFGRQLGSFRQMGSFNNLELELVFIRAPYIESVSEDTEVLTSFDGMILAAREGNMLATAFHPELSNSSIVHEYFIQMVLRQKEKVTLE